MTAAKGSSDGPASGDERHDYSPGNKTDIAAPASSPETTTDLGALYVSIEKRMSVIEHMVREIHGFLFEAKVPARPKKPATPHGLLPCDPIKKQRALGEARKGNHKALNNYLETYEWE